MPARNVPSIDGLNPDDPGIALLASAVTGAPSREILLVATGEVPGIGPECTRLVLDVRELHLPGARPFTFEGDAPAGFAHALVWPRAHLGKDFTVACLARGALSLREGGSLSCAVRKAKGADSIAVAMERIVGNVAVQARDRGYRLLRSQRTAAFDPAAAEAALAVRHAIDDPSMGDVELHAVPGVFSRRRLDDGTRCLIEHATADVLEPPARVLDLGAGIGPLAVWAARRWQAARVLAVEANLLAAACCEHNARAAGVNDRVRVAASAGLPSVGDDEALRSFVGSVDLALVNPPTHADPEQLRRFVEDALGWLSPAGRAMFVVSRASALVGGKHSPLPAPGGRAHVAAGTSPADRPADQQPLRVQVHAYSRYTVVVAGRPC